MCTCYFFRIYLDFFFFFFLIFLSSFSFSWKRKFQVCREKGALKCFGDERREGWGEASRWGGSDEEEEEEDEEEEGGLEYLSLFSLSLFLSPSVCGASLWHTSVMRKTPPACLVSGRWRWPVWAPPACSCPRPSSSSCTPATSPGRQQTKRPRLLPLSPLKKDRKWIS